ncbi:MAG TPA: hypothetical protein VE569_08160 [Acidimicrobiia bacterium]|jgi:hypothetical protein|nr:hypothetical protein [Acidimicrobiia bacterium]
MDGYQIDESDSGDEEGFVAAQPASDCPGGSGGDPGDGEDEGQAADETGQPDAE